jgi:hypothetical protein
VVPSLQLLEEADILDGDDGLIGEGLEQGNFPLREWAGAAVRTTAPDGDCSDGRPFSQQWHRQEATVTDRPCHLQARRCHAWIVFEVPDMNDSPVQDRLGHDTRSTGRCGIHPVECFARLSGDIAVLGAQVDESAIEPVDRR